MAVPVELVKLRRTVEQLSLKLSPPESAAPTFEEFAPVFLADRRAEQQKPGTLNQKARDLRLHVLPRFGAIRLDEVTEAQVTDFKASLAPRDPKTINNILSVLSMVLKVAIRRKVLPRMPVRIEPLKLEERGMGFYEDEDYTALCEAAARQDRRTVALVLLGGDAGLRGGEMRALEWPCVDFRRGLVGVERSSWEGIVTSTKGRKIRRVPMTVALKAALRALKKRAKGARVLVRDDGSPVSRQTQRSWMKRAQKAARLRATGGLHILRHTFCSRLAMRGAPAVAIRELAGHSSLRTTLRYMHLAPSEAGRAIALLDGAVQNQPQWEATMTKAQKRASGPSRIRKFGGRKSESRESQTNPVDALGASEPFGVGHYFGSPKQLAALLHVPLRSVYRLINDGPLVARRVGKRRLRIYRDDLRRFLELARVH